MKFTNETFENKQVFFDGQDFDGCTFNNCHMVFTGIAPFAMNNVTVRGGTWAFEGPARNTVIFMTALYAQGGESRKLIEKTFDDIKAGV